MYCVKILYYRLLVMLFLALLSLLPLHKKVYAQDNNVRVMLAQKYSNQSIKGWLASEKLDGVRGY